MVTTRYLGQCDVVRRAGASSEHNWQAMIAGARRVSFRTFLANVDLSPLLDEDETPRAYLASALRSDPATTAYRSWWGPERCWFLQTAGFEFIFLEQPCTVVTSRGPSTPASVMARLLCSFDGPNVALAKTQRGFLSGVDTYINTPNIGAAYVLADALHLHGKGALAARLTSFARGVERELGREYVVGQGFVTPRRKRGVTTPSYETWTRLSRALYRTINAIAQAQERT